MPTTRHLTTEKGHIGVLRIVGTVIPVVYLWSLPLLAKLGFANTCPGFPKCDHEGVSVSRYIDNTHGTGAMAAVFFFPSLHLWLNAEQVSEGSLVYPTLFLFQLGFGMFLICPISLDPNLHPWAVCLFCVSALVHYGVVLKHCAGSRLKYCRALLCVAIFAFAGVFILTCIASAYPTVLPNNCPWLFYIMEATGLSTMAVFPMLWYREVENNRLEDASVEYPGAIETGFVGS